MENQKLREMNEQLKTENDTLKLLLKSHGYVLDASTTTPSVEHTESNEILS